MMIDSHYADRAVLARLHTLLVALQHISDDLELSLVSIKLDGAIVEIERKIGVKDIPFELH